MIFEHEIPDGCKLYFGKNAKRKRELEFLLSNFFYGLGFEEIVTPNFSYSGHQSIDNERELIKTSDELNNEVALRADSTLDVARIITKRLGRTTKHKKWFYIQPIFTYPSHERYQIGCEWLEHKNLCDSIDIATQILSRLKIEPFLQITNINIPKMVASELNLDLNIFKNSDISKLFEYPCKWLHQLISVTNKIELEDVQDILPPKIARECQKVIEIADKIKYENLTLSPLYFAPMKYYNDIYFRIIQDNLTLARGGKYLSDGLESLGFAFYTDNLLKILEDI